MDFNSIKKVKTILVFLYTFFLLAASLAADSKTQHSDYIYTLETFAGKEFRHILIEELEEYIRLYPNADNSLEMHLKLATIFHDNKNKSRSFFSHIEILYLYNDLNAATTARDRVRSIILDKKKYNKLKNQIEPLLNPKLQNTSRESAYRAFLRDMVGLQLTPIRELIIKACAQFLAAYPLSKRADEVLFWRAEQLAENDEPRRALADYLKLTYLYGSSLYLTASKLKIADIFTEKLKDHQTATLTLEEFLLEYPADPQAALAQLRIAQITEKRKKKPLEALNAYTAVAEKYPQSLEAVPALFEAARLYEKKFKEYDQAIRIYTEIVRDFPKDLKAPHAMAEAARIYEKRLKDYYSAANFYYKVYELYSASTIAPQSLFAAAELNEKRLNHTDNALAYYRIIVEKYPDHKLVKKAGKRITKLSKVLITR